MKKKTGRGGRRRGSGRKPTGATVVQVSVALRPVIVKLLKDNTHWGHESASHFVDEWLSYAFQIPTADETKNSPVTQKLIPAFMKSGRADFRKNMLLRRDLARAKSNLWRERKALAKSKVKL
jgi:hypothetical protein